MENMKKTIVDAVKSEIELSKIIRLPTLLFLCYIFYFVYKQSFIDTVAPISSVSLTFLGIPYWLFYIAAIITTLFVISFIWDSISSGKKGLNMDPNKLCNDCLTEKSSPDNILHRYNLFTLSYLINTVEKNLCKDDEVIIYTSNAATEESVKQVVEKNYEKGVKYNLMFYKKSNIAENLYASITDLSILSHNAGIDCDLSKLNENTGFDIFIVKKQGYFFEAFFAINYSVGTCMRPAFGGCKDPCDRENKNLFYKKIEPEQAEAVFKQLKNIIELQGNTVSALKC